MNNKLNPFVPNAPFLYPLKRSENLSFLIFSGVEKACIANEWVKMIKERADQWKMNFRSNPSKQDQVTFSTKKTDHLLLVFNIYVS